jgi:hypothetical protein
MFIMCLFGSQNTEEHVEGDLDRVEVDQSVLCLDELEVKGMDNGPHLPAGLACGQKVSLDLGGNGGKGVAVDESKVRKEDGHEDGAPEDLVNGDLGGNVLGGLSRNLLVEPVVKVVSRRSVVEKTECRKSNESLPVEGSTADEDLRKMECMNE